jgi:hypothetical protein
MKLGMIFESGAQGADRQVCRHLAEELDASIEVEYVNHMNKPEMISACGKDVRHLMAQGCEKVLIVWDLYPSPHGSDRKPCRKEDRDAIVQSLTYAGMEDEPVHLVCITEELEAWILADGRALTAYLSRPSHPAKKIRSNKKPDQISSPKKRLIKLFRENGRGKYNSLVDAIRIVKRLPDLNHLRRSPSFRRFEEKLMT